MKRRRLAPSLLALVLLACGPRSASSPPEAPLPSIPETPTSGGTAPTPLGGSIRVVTPLWVATATPGPTPPPEEAPSPRVVPPPLETPAADRPAATRTSSPAPTATGMPAPPGAPIRVVTPLWVATAVPSRTPTASAAVPVETPGTLRPAATWTASPTPTATPDPCPALVYEREPAEAFDWIGIVEVQRKRPSDRFATLVESARQSACRLGGDGIVVIYHAHRRPGGIAERPQPGMLPKVDLRAVVIRFRR